MKQLTMKRSTGIRPILRPGRNCWKVLQVDETGLLIDGRDYYRAFYEAARRASSHILMCGWQFDSEARLVRGKDLPEGAGEVRLLSFLNSLCEKNASLEIYILAWDFSLVFTLEREWFQKWVWDWTTNPRLRFRFDSSHAIGASHHQKFVVIDGHTAFAGGMDICADRWDDRRHLARNPERTDGDPYGPYHDIQAYFTGPAAARLAEYFTEKWELSGGGELALPPVPPTPPRAGFKPTIPISANQVALSRTYGRVSLSQEPVDEIKLQYMDAILSAGRLIYIETQYFTSFAVYRAFAGRMSDRRGDKLQIVIMLPKKSEAVIEQMAMGGAQAAILSSLKEIARQTGHELGIYYSAPFGGEEDAEEIPTYIHSKLLVVDDRFLSVGSANLTNRSLGFDTELNVSWEASLAGEEKNSAGLCRSIRHIRTSCLAELAGVFSPCSERRPMGQTEGLVSRLDAMAASGRYRLRHLPIEKPAAYGNKAIPPFTADSFSPFDPQRAVIEEGIFELLSVAKNGFFAKGITLLKNTISGKQPPAGSKHSATNFNRRA